MIVKCCNKIIDSIIFISLLLVQLYSIYIIYDYIAIYRGSSSQAVYQAFQIEEESKLDIITNYSDVKGWIQLGDIDYPILQGQSNNQYLRTNLEGEYSLSGSIFLDYRNTSDLSDNYQIIYGHNMQAGTMFGTLDKYLDSEYMENNNIGILTTTKEVTIEVFASFVTDIKDIYLYTPIYQEEIISLLDYIVINSEVYRNIEISNDDQVIALSTCKTTGSTERIVVLAVMKQ